MRVKKGEHGLLEVISNFMFSNVASFSEEFAVTELLSSRILIRRSRVRSPVAAVMVGCSLVRHISKRSTGLLTKEGIMNTGTEVVE